MRQRQPNHLLIIWMSSLMLLVAGCAGVQESWNKLTPSEKSRIIIGDVQAQLDTLFDTGKTFVASHPEKAAEWKGKIVPAFDAANTTLRGVMDLSLGGNLEPGTIYAKMQPALDKVRNLLIQIGAIKP